MSNASRTMACRAIDYSAPLKFDGKAALRKLIISFIKGIRGPRRNAVTEAQILDWFRGTPDAFIRDCIMELIASGEVRIGAKSLGSHRKPNGAYVYETAA